MSSIYCFEPIKNEKIIEENLTGWNLPISEKVKISQGFDGPYSHLKIKENADYTFSLDFVVSPNSEVLASKKGIVTLINKDDEVYRGIDFNKGIYFPGNRIILNHGKGIYSLYEHLSEDCFSKFNIHEGKKVKQGETIGATGFSGWVGPIPHLHFNVFAYIKNLKSSVMKLKTIPIKFNNYNGELKDKDLPMKHIFNCQIA
jgi:murein DD-endopeptidase MepM/ murein hydrolase activator NlpD